jgi:hypothetical protein
MLSSNTSAVSGDTTYIEDVFSTYLYTGTGATQTITNNIDLAGKGGLTWIKDRTAAIQHFLTDTVRGAGKALASNLTDAQGNNIDHLSAFTSSGFSVGIGGGAVNTSGNIYTSWTFREQPKFFDVVTYTGTGVARTVAHSLGSIPGCIIVKRTDAAASWFVYHRSLGATQRLTLEGTGAASAVSSAWNNTDPTSTEFTVGTGSTNTSGGTYVAYIFAHDAGGFGLTGTDNVISCGSYTGNGTTNFSKTITLGYEPQWVLVKDTSSGYGSWFMLDTMRGWNTSAADMYLTANSANAESDLGLAQPNSTGFAVGGTTELNSSGVTYIYIAIRRGPMKVPTDATKVFAPIARTGTGSDTSLTGLGFAPDAALISDRTQAVFGSHIVINKLTGPQNFLFTTATSSEDIGTAVSSFNNDGVSLLSTGRGNSATTWINEFFRRAPGFFDQVCYTGVGGVAAFNHNLGVTPELLIVKCRSADAFWYVWHSSFAYNQYIKLQTNEAVRIPGGTGNEVWGQSSPNVNTTTFNVGPNSDTNGVKQFVAYLFATCAGVSKVGSYTGTGTTLQVDCGFAAGARFVLIKRTDTTGDWYIWDTARGIVSGNDPYLRLNSTGAEVTTTDYIDPYSAGFELSSTAPAALNASGGTYIFLAIA